VWHLFDQAAKEETHQDMEEAALDTRSDAGVKGAAGNVSVVRETGTAHMDLSEENAVMMYCLGASFLPSQFASRYLLTTHTLA
jgi:hypothetical protein